jgi:hypothetical protein
MVRRSVQRIVLACIALSACIALNSPLLAHHAYGGYDRSRSQTITGTVAGFEWINPHIHLVVWVPNVQSSAGYDVYDLEAGSVLMMTRFRWTNATFQVGEKVTLTFFPLADGRHGGGFIKARHENGSWTTGDLAGVNYFSR